jgi:hypothetical protein
MHQPRHFGGGDSASLASAELCTAVSSDQICSDQERHPRCRSPLRQSSPGPRRRHRPRRSDFSTQLCRLSWHRRDGECGAKFAGYFGSAIGPIPDRTSNQRPNPTHATVSAGSTNNGRLTALFTKPLALTQSTDSISSPRKTHPPGRYAGSTAALPHHSSPASSYPPPPLARSIRNAPTQYQTDRHTQPTVDAAS